MSAFASTHYNMNIVTVTHYEIWLHNPAKCYMILKKRCYCIISSVPELPNNKPYQSPKQSHAEDHPAQIEATSREDHRWRTGRLQSRKEYHRADLQATHSMWEISPAPARPLPCLHRFQEGLGQGLACSFVGNHEEVQHQHQSCPSHQKHLWQGH